MKTYKISDISIYPFNENGKKFVEENIIIQIHIVKL